MKIFFKRVAYTILFLFVLLNIVCAFHAYKFTHFYNSDAVVKKPELMNGWEKTQAIMFGVNYPKKKIAEFPLRQYKDFVVKTDDGLSLRGWRMQSSDTLKNRGAVLMLHGHANNRAAILNEAEAFRAFGYSVYMIDFRAHGQSEGDICTIGYYESKDVKALYDFVRKEYADDQIVLYGISLGAATITKAVSDYPGINPSKIILEMPFATLTDAVKGRLRSMHLPAQPFAALLTFWGGTQQGFNGFNHNPEEYVRKIKCPVLLQWGVNDARVTREETERLFANIGSKQKTFVPYEQSAHESLNKRENLKWTETVRKFLQ